MWYQPEYTNLFYYWAIVYDVISTRTYQFVDYLVIDYDVILTI